MIENRRSLPALWLVLLDAAGTFALTMGTRQTMGLFLSPINTSTRHASCESTHLNS